MQLFDSRLHSKILESRITDYLGSSHASSLRTLVIIQVGDNAASEKYISLKSRLCEEFGIPVAVVKFPEGTNFEELYNSISSICEDPTNSSVIIQLPLPFPEHSTLLNLIPIEKDIDLLSHASQEQYYGGNFDRLSPVVRSLEYFISTIGLTTKHLRVCVFGSGVLVGKPIAHYLSAQGSDVKVYNETTEQPKYPLDYDLVVLGTGVPGIVTASSICPGAAVVDFGSTVVNGKIKGDFATMGDSAHISYLAPSPGGLGPLVVRFLVMNHLGI